VVQFDYGPDYIIIEKSPNKLLGLTSVVPELVASSGFNSGARTVVCSEGPRSNNHRNSPNTVHAKPTSFG